MTISDGNISDIKRFNSGFRLILFDLDRAPLQRIDLIRVGRLFCTRIFDINDRKARFKDSLRLSTETDPRYERIVYLIKANTNGDATC